jgi:hypothetical protein
MFCLSLVVAVLRPSQQNLLMRHFCFALLQITFNGLKPSGHYYIFHMGYHTTALRSAHRVHLCVSYGSYNKQRFFP